jgi:hypothetical protein
MSKKLTQEEAEQIFIDGGGTFDDVYIDSNKKYNYTCSCGNKGKILVYTFKVGVRCKQCGIKKYSKKQSLSQEDVEKIFSDERCIFDDIYINSKTKHKYICSCGNKSLITVNRFQQGGRCMLCSITRKLTYEYVYNYFKERGCELLEDKYINTQTKMKYKCKCGNIAYIQFNNFKQGGRCINCRSIKSSKRMSGSNNPFWVKDREKVSSIKRLRKSFKRRWVIKNMKHDPNYDNYTLNLEPYHIDHIIPISIFRDLIFEYNLDEQEVRKVINKIDNLQILTKYINETKKIKGCINEAKQYLINHGINLDKIKEDALVKEYINSR